MRQLRIAILALMTLVSFNACSRIDAGHVGLKINMAGGDKGVSNIKYVTGWVFYMPGASKIEEIPTFVQHKEYDGIEVYARGGIKWQVKPALNYQVNADKADSMYQKFRVGLSTLEEGWMKNVTYQACRDVLNTFDSDSLLNHREQFEVQLSTELGRKFKPYFTVSNVTSGLTPPGALAASIERKTVSIQEKQAAENQRAVVEAQTLTAIVQARGDSTVRLINTQAEAKSIQLKQDALKQSPQYIDLIKAERWDGHMPQIVSGSGGMMLQLPVK